MTTATTRPAAPSSSTLGTDTRTFDRWVAALLMPIGPAALAVLRFILPYDTTDTPAEMVAGVAADQAAQAAVLWLGTVAVFTLIPGAVAVVRLVRPTAPRLTTVAAAFLIPGYLGLFGTASVDTDILVGLRAGIDPATLTRLVVAQDTGPGVVAITVFVVGHIVGSVLLGVAFWRSRVVHQGWAAAMVVSQPLHLLAAMTANHPLDLLGWGLTALAMGAAAVALLRTPNSQWDVPARV
jgi:hypothetical protein